MPSEEVVEKTLAALREDSATGPDAVPTRALRRLAKVLAVPVHKLAERIVEVGNALSFNFVWDGNDLLRMFSKEVFIQ